MERVTCRFCGCEHVKPGPLQYSGAFQDNHGAWWCRDGRACRRRMKQAVQAGEVGGHG
jgi:hypothetical protein